MSLICYLLRSDSYYINTKGWMGGCANGSLDDVAKISATSNFSSVIQLPTSQSTPLSYPPNGCRKRPVATGLQPVFEIWPKVPDRNRFMPVAGKTGNRGSVATDTGPVRLPVFCRSFNRTLKHYLGSNGTDSESLVESSLALGASGWTVSASPLGCDNAALDCEGENTALSIMDSGE